MLEIARYEAGRRRRSSVVLAVALGVVAAFFVAFFPSFEEAGVEDIQDAFPPALQEMFGIEAMDTIEGFLAVEIYNFVWVLFVGLFFAYTAAGIVARGVETGTFELLYSYPVSRRRVVFEQVGSLAVPVVVLNVVVALSVYVGVFAIGESIDPIRLLMVHALSIPYFLACIGIGLLLSVSVRRADVAQRIALGVVFGLWLLDSITASIDDLAWVGRASPTYYYDPTAVLVHGTYDLVDAAVLVVAFSLLVALGVWRFDRRDV